MAADFNPYHVWLSIPPEEQPPNLYRLLGLRMFETNGDVIDNAADRQTAHLRTIQGGKHGELTQRLLNEVAAARVSLLDPKKRAEYDQQLRAKLAAAAPTPAAQPAGQPAKPPVPLRRAAAQADAEKWDDLLGDSSARTPQNSGIKSSKSLQAAAKQDVKNRQVSVYVAAAVVLIVAAGIGFFVLNRKADGTLVLDWPASDLMDVAISVDGSPIEIPATGPWEHNYPAGPHHFVAQRPAFKMTADITLPAGERMSIMPEWKPRAILKLNWPLPDRAGAELEIDGRPLTVSQSATLEFPVEPGRHVVQIKRAGYTPFNATPVVVEAQPAIVVVLSRSPEDARLVFDWPTAQRNGAAMTIDGRTISGFGVEPFELKLKPGRHEVHITRPGFLACDQTVELSSGVNPPLRPTWTAIRTAAISPQATRSKVTTPNATTARVAETTVPAETTTPSETTAPQPAKKLPAPPAADQERVAKQLDELYQTSRPGSKDAAKAQELYDLAAKAAASPVERYMLLLKGAEIAAIAGDLSLSMQGIDTLDGDYDIDVLEAKQKLMDKFIAAGKPEKLVEAIPMAEQLVDQAVAADRFDIAAVLATSASKAVAKSKIATHKEDEERLSRRRHDIHLLEPIYSATTKAQETLKKTPADPEANLIVGRWLCLYKGDWTIGLPLLAKGSDENLKTLAEQEIKAPTEADQQVQLADAWWDRAPKEAGIARDSLRRHAGGIYQVAMPNLGSALKKAAIEKRLTEIAGPNQDHPAIAITSQKAFSDKLIGAPFFEFCGPNGFWGSHGVPDDALKQLKTVTERNKEDLKCFAFAPSGDWVFLFDGNGFTTSNVNLPACQKLAELQGQPGMNFKCVAFAPAGGWTILWNQNGNWTQGDTPAEAFERLQELVKGGSTLRSIAFGPGGAWVLMFDQTGVLFGDVPNDLAKVLDNAAKKRFTVLCVAFMGSDWICITSGGSWTSNANLSAAKLIDKHFKQGQSPKWIAVKPTLGK